MSSTRDYKQYVTLRSRLQLKGPHLEEPEIQALDEKYFFTVANCIKRILDGIKQYLNYVPCSPLPPLFYVNTGLATLEGYYQRDIALRSSDVIIEEIFNFYNVLNNYINQESRSVPKLCEYRDKLQKFIDFLLENSLSYEKDNPAIQLIRSIWDGPQDVLPEIEKEFEIFIGKKIKTDLSKGEISTKELKTIDSDRGFIFPSLYYDLMFEKWRSSKEASSKKTLAEKIEFAQKNKVVAIEDVKREVDKYDTTSWWKFFGVTCANDTIRTLKKLVNYDHTLLLFSFAEEPSDADLIRMLSVPKKDQLGWGNPYAPLLYRLGDNFYFCTIVRSDDHKIEIKKILMTAQLQGHEHIVPSDLKQLSRKKISTLPKEVKQCVNQHYKIGISNQQIEYAIKKGEKKADLQRRLSLFYGNKFEQDDINTGTDQVLKNLNRLYY